EQQSVSGRVTDENGAPIEAVTVTIKGTSSAVTTDAGGNFRVNVASERHTLVFTAVGYHALEVNLAGRTEIDVILKTQISDLDEVVVVGYGTQKRSNLTGAVSNVSVP